MRKFGQAFLTTSAVILLLANLIIILLYGRQFYACVDSSGIASGGFCGSGGQPAMTSQMVWLNIFVIFVLVLVWLAIRYYHHRFPTD